MSTKNMEDNKNQAADEQKKNENQTNRENSIKVSMPAEGKRKKQQQNSFNPILLWALIISSIFLFIRMIDNTNMSGPIELNYNEFSQLLNMKKEQPEFNINSVKIEQRDNGTAKLTGQLDDSTTISKLSPRLAGTTGLKFLVNLPFLDSEILQQWENAELSFQFKERPKELAELFMGIILPVLFIILLIIMFRGMRNGAGSSGGIFGFGKSRVKQHVTDSNTKTFADVAGADEAKNELKEIVDYLKFPQKYKKLGGKIPRGVLLLGSPGTGKTLLAKAVAGEAKVPFFSMSGSDFEEMFVGVGASRVRDLFDTAKKQSPCIIFIDEIDTIGHSRNSGHGFNGTDQTLNQMLTEMDGFEENSGIIVIAATNRPDILDPALLRAGRFDRKIVVDVPDAKGRKEILMVHTKNLPLADDVDLEILAKGTPGFVGADLANLANEAALFAARFGQDKVKMIDFEEAKDKIAMGTERKSLVLSEKEKKMTAYHEAGHAICTLKCENADPLHKVTIIPRGRALGVTYSVPEEDKHSYSKDYILDRICVAMGGRAAEKIIFNNLTTGASNDIKVSTELVRKMICEFGMTDMGPIAFGDKEEQSYLRDVGSRRDFSEKTAEEIDEMIKKIMFEQEERAIEILTNNRNELELLANALIEHELLDKEEIDKIISGDVLEKAKKSRDKNLVPLETNKTSENTEDNAVAALSTEYYEETVRQNQQMIENINKCIENEENIIRFLDMQIAAEENKTPIDKKKIKSYSESIKQVQQKIKFFRKNIRLSEEIILLSNDAILRLKEAAEKEITANENTEEKTNA